MDLMAVWASDRVYLVDLAYRMLGDLGEAEDAVQEAFARFARVGADSIDEPRAWLTVVTSRLCLDQLRSARRRRDRPQDDLRDDDAVLHVAPISDPADRIGLDEEVRLAMLLVLERLSPPERVAFVLHDVFQLPFDSVASILGRSAATCRQLAHRARTKLADFPGPTGGGAASTPEQRLVTERFIQACATGRLEALTAVLDPTVWGVATFLPQGTRSPVSRGPAEVARTVLGYLGPPTTLVSQPLVGQAAVLAFRERRPFAIAALTVRESQVVKIAVTARPRPSADRYVTRTHY